MLVKLKKRMDELSENFNKGIANMKKNQQLKKTITDKRNALEELNNRLDDAEQSRNL